MRTIIAFLTMIIASIAVPSGSAHAAADPIGAAYEAVTPCRLFDSRTGAGELVGTRTHRIQVSGRCGIEAGISAAALTVTALRASGNGYVTAYSAGEQRPLASNLNYRPGRVVANTAIVATEAGAVDVYTHTDVEIVVDVNGVFRDVDEPVAAGRLVPTEPRRVVDTREPPDARSTGVTGYGSGDLQIDFGGVVPVDATAVAISVASVEAERGFITIHPAGTRRPTASVLNTDDRDPTRATTVLAAVADGKLTVHRHSPGHLVVDLWGYFTGPEAEPGTDGLFVAERPGRVWDSRTSHDPLHPGGRLTRTVAPDEASVAVVNVTSVGSTGAGYLTVGPAGATQPPTSNLNYRWVEPIAAMTLAPNTIAGITFWSHAGTHVVVDRFGWFTGGARPASRPADDNPMPARGGRVLFVSDSSFAGIRWNGALGWLTGADFDHRLESCRRLTGASCRGREGYAPPTALAEVLSVPIGSVDTLVIATGYNDDASRFASGFEQVMWAARSVGIERVVWITYREPVTYLSPQHASNAATFAANNRTLWAAAASGSWPELRLLDWNAHSAGKDQWLTRDGVHLTVDGAREAARFVSRALAHDDRRPCGTIGGASDIGGWCADPTGRS